MVDRNDDLAHLTPEIRERFRQMQATHPHFQMPRFLSAVEVSTESFERSKRIFENWGKLNDCLKQYEDVLQKRWIKKTREQRKKVLLTAWPHMATSHRPDFEAMRQEDSRVRIAKKTRFRNEYLFPYINQEDLLKPHNLLLFLHSRGHNKPGVFAYFDVNMTKFARGFQAIQPGYLDGWTMILNGMDAWEEYGTIASWDEN